MLRHLGYFLRRAWWAHCSSDARLTLLLVWSNVAVFLAQVGLHAYFESAWLEEVFALSAAGLAEHRYWQVLSYGWLHSTHLLFLHLLFNVLMVFFLGKQLEGPLGPLRFLILYLGGCLVAGLVWLVAEGFRSEAALLGASGAVFGLVMAYASYDPDRVIKAYVLFIIPIKLRARNLALILVGSEVVMLWFGLLPQVAHSAHLGGAAFGWIVMQAWKVRARDAYHPLEIAVTKRL